MTPAEMDVAVIVAERIAQPEIAHALSGEEIGAMRDYILATHALVRAAVDQGDAAFRAERSMSAGFKREYDTAIEATNSEARRIREEK